MSFMLIICQTVEGISMVGQFRDFFKIYFWTSFWHSALLCGSAGAATEAAILHAVVLSVRESTQWGNCWLSSSLFLSNSSNVVMRRFGDSSRHERKRNVAFFRLGQDGTTLLVWPSRIPYRIPKFISALGADEFLAMLEDEIRGTQFKKNNLVK